MILFSGNFYKHYCTAEQYSHHVPAWQWGLHQCQ